VIVARVSGGPDPRTIGSGRTGGANVMRALGPRLALVSGLLDMVKGTAAVLLALLLGAGPEVEVLAGLAAIVGHSRSPFLGLSGGRGVAPAFGAGLVFSPIAALVTLVTFLGVLAAFRYTSLASLTGSLVGGIVFAVQVVATGMPTALLGFAIGAPVLIWLFHLDNIGRLVRGEERKFGTK
jgi:glycerol-3-phosphate acyltransferase PlsY